MRLYAYMTMSQLAAQFKALSEDTRLRILALMFRHGELCVCEVERFLDISQSRASRHLRYLLNAGVVEDRREGLWVYYRVAQPASQQQRSLLEALRGLLEDIEVPDISSQLGSMRAERCNPSPADAEASTRRSAKVQ